MCRGWIGLVDRRTAAVMPTGGLGWFPLRRPVVARAQSLWRHPGRGRRPGCPVTPRLPRGASKNLDAPAAADRWRPARSWCSLGLTAVRADRAGGRSVAGEVGHHLLALDGVNGTADAVGFGQRRGGGWAAVFTPDTVADRRSWPAPPSEARLHARGNTRPHRHRRGRGDGEPAPHRCR